jgi:hypothetical protein
MPEPAIIELQPGKIHVPSLIRSLFWTPAMAAETDLPHDIAERLERGEIWGGASFSDYAELAILDHIFNDPSFTAPTPRLGLWSAGTTLTDATTGTATNEANYTTYARLAIATSDMNAALTGSKTNGATLTFAACTAGTTTVTQWAVLDNATVGAGNAIVWGTATSTVISTTQTPPTVAPGAGGLTVTLD